MADKKLSTVIHFILDQTGSMQSIKKQTVNGFNEYLQTMKSKSGKFLFSLTKFSSIMIERPYEMMNIKKVRQLTEEGYNPNGGTPLFDACVDSIEATVKEVDRLDEDAAVLIVILTDGEENSSERHTQECLRDLIQKLEKRGNWTFVFMGPELTAWETSKTLGISANNTRGWKQTPEGANDIMRSVAMASMDYSSAMEVSHARGGELNSKSFFVETPEEIKK